MDRRTFLKDRRLAPQPVWRVPMRRVVDDYRQPYGLTGTPGGEISISAGINGRKIWNTISSPYFCPYLENGRERRRLT